MSGAHESDLCNFFVFARFLGVYDEAADLCERVEKILYFYPSDTPPEVQLSLIDTCEGVIDVTGQFTNVSGRTCVAEGRFQCACVRGEGVVTQREAAGTPPRKHLHQAAPRATVFTPTHTLAALQSNPYRPSPASTTLLRHPQPLFSHPGTRHRPSTTTHFNLICLLSSLSPPQHPPHPHYPNKPPTRSPRSPQTTPTR